MRISRFLAVLILVIAILILQAVAIFGTDNRYYYQTIAYILSFVLLLALMYQIRRGVPSETAIRAVSPRTSLILVALGSFLLGAAGGIAFYDSYWGFNDILFRPSVNLSIHSLYGALFLEFSGFAGGILLVIGLSSILRRK